MGRLLIQKIQPVILCGGSGTRLWPVSRESFGKQFNRFIGTESLFQSSVKRLSGPLFFDPILLTTDTFRFVVDDQMAEMGRHPRATFLEPCARNTAPAVLASALWYQSQGSDGLMLVAPSDHVISDQNRFQEEVRAACDCARSGEIVTFGIVPTRPETGYGYLQFAQDADREAVYPQKLSRFIEKPNAEYAATMISEGRSLWNAGIFLFTPGVIIEAYRAHAPAMLALVEKALAQSHSHLQFTRLAEDAWRQLDDVSIDYAIMEKVSNLSVMPYGGGWSDLGSWEAVWQESDPDTDGNVISDHATAIQCTGTLLRSESPNMEVVGIGLEDIVAIAMPDALLVARRRDTQRVKEAVEILKAKKAKQATDLSIDRRPWGWFQSLAVGEGFQAKQIVVNPGGSLSLQSHRHRSEHWILVQGTAKVTIDETVRILRENQSVFVPLGAIHRLENPGPFPLVLIEVQVGFYLGEDDIVRYEDLYERDKKAYGSDDERKKTRVHHRFYRARRGVSRPTPALQSLRSPRHDSPQCLHRDGWGTSSLAWN